MLTNKVQNFNPLKDSIEFYGMETCLKEMLRFAKSRDCGEKYIDNLINNLELTLSDYMDRYREEEI